MPTLPPRPTPLTEQASALVAEIERTLAEGQAQLRALGLDPQKVRDLGATLSPELRERAEAAQRADLEAIEQEVAEALARTAAAAPAKSRPPRRFV